MERRGALRVSRIAGGQAMRLVSGDVKVGIAHAERIEDPLFQKLLEWLARDLADEVADHIGRSRVVEGFTRREFEWNLGQSLDHRIKRSGLLHLADLHAAI